jgi:hypothetical protein
MNSQIIIKNQLLINVIFLILQNFYKKIYFNLDRFFHQSNLYSKKIIKNLILFLI